MTRRPRPAASRFSRCCKRHQRLLSTIVLPAGASLDRCSARGAGDGPPPPRRRESLSCFLRSVMKACIQFHSITAFPAGGSRDPCTAGDAAPPPPRRESLPSSLRSVTSVFTALFVASMGLIMSPAFLWAHLGLLAAGSAAVFLLKVSYCYVRLH